MASRHRRTRGIDSPKCYRQSRTRRSHISIELNDAFIDLGEHEGHADADANSQERGYFKRSGAKARSCGGTGGKNLVVVVSAKGCRIIGSTAWDIHAHFIFGARRLKGRGVDREMGE